MVQARRNAEEAADFLARRTRISSKALRASDMQAVNYGKPALW